MRKGVWIVQRFKVNYLVGGWLRVWWWSMTPDSGDDEYETRAANSLPTPPVHSSIQRDSRKRRWMGKDKRMNCGILNRSCKIQTTKQRLNRDSMQETRHQRWGARYQLLSNINHSTSNWRTKAKVFRSFMSCNSLPSGSRSLNCHWSSTAANNPPYVTVAINVRFIIKGNLRITFIADDPFKTSTSFTCKSEQTINGLMAKNKSQRIMLTTNDLYAKKSNINYQRETLLNYPPVNWLMSSRSETLKVNRSISTWIIGLGLSPIILPYGLILSTLIGRY